MQQFGLLKFLKTERKGFGLCLPLVPFLSSFFLLPLAELHRLDADNAGGLEGKGVEVSVVFGGKV